MPFNNNDDTDRSESESEISRPSAIAEVGVSGYFTLLQRS